MSATCQDCGIPLPVDSTGYEWCTCVEDEARHRRTIVTIGWLDPQPPDWAYATPAAFRVEWDPRLHRVVDTTGWAQTFERPEQALIASHDRIELLGGAHKDTWALMVCLSCGDAQPDDAWPCPRHVPEQPGDRFRCHVTGRFAARLSACNERAWASTAEEARHLFETIPHRAACACRGCMVKRITYTTNCATPRSRRLTRST